MDAFELCYWRRLLSPLDCKEIKPFNPKGNQPWIYIGRADAKAEAPKFWPPGVKSRLIRKDPDAEKDWRQKEKGATENEMAGGHHWLSAHEFEQAPGDSEGQGSLACCSPWEGKESDMTEWWENNKNKNNVSLRVAFSVSVSFPRWVYQGNEYREERI